MSCIAKSLNARVGPLNNSTICSLSLRDLKVIMSVLLKFTYALSIIFLS